MARDRFMRAYRNNSPFNKKMSGGLMDPNDPWADEEGGDIAPPIDPLFGASPRPGIKRPGYRSPGGIDPQMQGTQGDLPGGIAQYDPFTQSDLAAWIDFMYGGGMIPDGGATPGSMGALTNISDFTEYFSNDIGFDNYYDWYYHLTGPDGHQNESQQTPNLSTFHGTGFYNSPVDYYMPGNTGMGNQGGAGDLGTGSYFAGGGMGTSYYGGPVSGTGTQDSTGLWEQDCSQIGPQYNMQGECIACCETQYANVGFYGHDASGFIPGDTTEINPDDYSGECFSQYQATADMGYQGSFEEFAGLYC